MAAAKAGSSVQPEARVARSTRLAPEKITQVQEQVQSMGKANPTQTPVSAPSDTAEEYSLEGAWMVAGEDKREKTARKAAKNAATAATGAPRRLRDRRYHADGGSSGEGLGVRRGLGKS